MKLLMVVIDETKKEELEVFLSTGGVLGFTEIPRALGVGLSGSRLGSRAFPQTSAVIFSILTPEALQEVEAGIEEFCHECGEELKMVAWDVQQIR